MPPYHVCGSIKEHFDLKVIALGRVVGHPAAGLEMKVLEIVGGPLAQGRLIEDFVVPSTFAPMVDAR